MRVTINFFNHVHRLLAQTVTLQESTDVVGGRAPYPCAFYTQSDPLPSAGLPTLHVAHDVDRASPESLGYRGCYKLAMPPRQAPIPAHPA